jgi:hypothetical protein
MTRTFRSRRLALVGAVMVLGLSACGTSDGAGSSPTTSALPAPQVIEVAGGAGSATTSGAAPAADASAEGMSTKMMAAYLTYVFQGEVPDLTAPSASWFFPAGATATDEQLQALADAFGVAGAPQDVPADMGGGRVIGDTGYSGPSVTIGTDALLSWWYNPGTGPVPTAEPCAYYPAGDPMGDPTTADLPVCEEPQPPANVPTHDEAEAKATELFTSLGLDLTQWSFDTYADEWGAYVTASYVVDGVTTTLSASVGYGAEGAITWASGFLATPQRGADYPRVGVDAAVQRLNDQTMAWMDASGPMTRMAEDTVSVSAGVGVAGSSGGASVGAATEVAPPESPDEAPTTDAATGTIAVDPVPMPPIDCLAHAVASSDQATSEEYGPVDTAVADTAVADTAVVGTEPAVTPIVDPAYEIAPCGEVPMGDPEPIEVTLTSPTASLEQVWAADGTVWLLPGYRFDTTDGSWVTVVAVEDQYLEQAQPDPLPIETPDGVTPDTAVPVDTVIVDGTNPSGTDVAEPVPAIDPATLKIVGLTVDEATTVLDQQALTIRVVRDDGADLPATADFRPDRVNVAVENGVITEVVSLG